MVLQIVTCDFGKLISCNYFLHESFCIPPVSSITPQGFFPCMDSPLLVLPRTSSWLHPLKHTKFLPWKVSFLAVLITVREVSLPTFFFRIHCSHLFLSYLNTMGLMIFKSSHVLIFFLLLARISFVPACYPDSLHPYIATENSFF